MNRGGIVVNMEESRVLHCLSDRQFHKRAEILEDLRLTLRRNGGVFPFPEGSKIPIFQALTDTLQDTNWDVRHKCTLFVCEAVPKFGDQLDECMHEVLPILIPGIGDSKITVRRAVMQTLHTYMKYSYDVPAIFHAISRFGLENRDLRVRREMTNALPVIITPEFSQEDFSGVTSTLARALVENHIAGADELALTSFTVLERIRELAGENSFNIYMQKMPPDVRSQYSKLRHAATNPGEPEISDVGPRKSRRPGQSGDNEVVTSWVQVGSQPIIHVPRTRQGKVDGLEFGIVPSHIMNRLGEGDFRLRAQAVEELKGIVNDLENPDPLAPHLLQFISFLNNLLDDSNFKISTVTLEILGSLVQLLNVRVKPHVKPIVLALTKRMGDNKIVIRQAIMKVVMQLMQILSPSPVISVISENLDHRNSRVRQETINIMIASLLTFPSVDFDLAALCKVIGPTLVDPKRQVRQASLECFAVLAQAMGAGKLQPLAQAVDDVELQYDGDGAMAAVQAKLARRQLPKLNRDGLVDYAAAIPTTASSRGSSVLPQGADTDWILSASGGAGSSARSTRSDAMELESVTSSARSTPAQLIQDIGPSPRKPRSAGRHSRLPWDDDADVTGSSNGYPGHNHMGNGRPVDGGRVPLKSRTTWAGEEMLGGADTNNKQRISRRKTVGQHLDAGRDDSPEEGSYRRLFLKKLTRQASEPLVVPPVTAPPLYNTTAQPPPPHPYSLDLDEESGFRSRRELSRSPRRREAGFSNTWPDSDMFEKAGKPNRKVLDPIEGRAPSGGDIDSARSPELYEDDYLGKDTSPIPTKPALARGSASRRKVPPIPVSRDEDDTGRGGREDGDEMLDSLRQIRHSASKKKAAKIFRRAEEERSPSPPGELFGLRDGDDMDDPALHRKSKRTDMSPGQDARGRDPRRGSFKDTELNNNQHLDFQPNGGVTFRPNKAADVQVVGRGYHDDSQVMDPKPTTFPANKGRERRRPTKSMLASPLAVTSSYGFLATDPDEDSIPTMGLYGKGMFDSGVSDGRVNGSRERRGSREIDPHHPPRGVYGIGVNQGSFDKSSGEESPDEDDEDGASMSMSKTTRERMATMVQKRQEEAEQRRTDEIRKQRTQTDMMDGLTVSGNKNKPNGTIRQHSPSEDLYPPAKDGFPQANGVAPDSPPPEHMEMHRPPPGRTNSVKLRKPKPSPTEETAAGNGYNNLHRQVSTSEPLSAADLTPFKDPHRGLDETLKQLESDAWETQVAGLNGLRRLNAFHPELLVENMKDINRRLMMGVRNLRSQVSKLAMTALAEMFVTLKKNMDVDLDNVVKGLLSEAAKSNEFIRNAAEEALTAMAENVTPQRAMISLVQEGASHKNVAVRKVTAQCLVQVVERMGPGRILSGVKDTTDRLLPAVASLSCDPNPYVRWYGANMLTALMHHPDFENMMNRHVSPASMRNVKERIKLLETKGLPERPSESTSSARARRSGQGSRSGSVTRGNSASSGVSEVSTGNSAGTIIKRKSTLNRMDDTTTEEVKTLIELMAAHDWQKRQEGIEMFQDLTMKNPDACISQLVKIFDKFIPCLKDSNSKVNLLALQVMLDVTPILSDSMGGVINLTSQTVASNLSSKNREIHHTATEVLDAFMDNIDGSLLLQPFVQQAQSGNTRVKTDMVQRVAHLTTLVYTRKPKQIFLHVSPLLWHLLGSGAAAGGGGNAQLRDATSGLVAALYSHMGPDLLQTASQNSSVTPRMKGLLKDLIDHP